MPETEARESWGNHCEFFLSSLGLAVGLGNVWRFPYLAFENGGGSFLLPYLLALVIVGLPAFFLELSAGQFGRVGANKLWGRMVPLLKGLGYGMLLVRFLVNIYYTLICAWAMIYLVQGFRSTLPWSECGNFEANTRSCYTKQLAEGCRTVHGTSNFTYYNSSNPDYIRDDACLSFDDFCKSFGLNYTGNGIVEECFDLTTSESKSFSEISQRVSPAEDYFNRVVLGTVKDYEGSQHSFEDYGTLRWEIVVGLAASWTLICLILIKGLKSLGKASYVITLAPYFVLTALLIYGMQLDGAVDGVKAFFTPDWSKYSQSDSYKIWADAASQILFSLSVGFGSQLVLSSYNEITNNCHRDAFLIGFFNSLTSLFAGIVVFAILGNLADGGPIGDVVKGGLSLAFVAYPEAVLKMDVPPLWSFLFFFMLINLALSSICGGVQTFLAFILDEVPSLTKHRVKIVIVSCIFFFLMGLPMCTAGGIHLFNIFDKRCTSSILLLVLVELVLVAWVYGVDNFLDDIAVMQVKLAKPVTVYWKVMWRFVCPIIISIIIILKWVTYEPMSYNGVEYPGGVQAVGWIFEVLPTCIVIFYPIWVLRKMSFSESRKPSPSWAVTTARSHLSPRVNEAFDDTIYKVSPGASLRKAQPSEEKLTEL